MMVYSVLILFGSLRFISNVADGGHPSMIRRALMVSVSWLMVIFSSVDVFGVISLENTLIASVWVFHA